MTAHQQPDLRGTLLLDEPMARHTSWRVGGPAQRFYSPADIADLSEFLRRLPLDENLVWLGLGSNLLVRDGGIRGTVIALHAALNVLELTAAQTVRAEAGVPCAKVARFCARHNRVGAEFLVGIPGTFGGALAMNAGAFGGETWRVVTAVQTIDRYGSVRNRAPADFQVGYRQVQGPHDEWFVGAHLQLAAGDGAAAQALSKQLLERRNQTQPTNQPSCGSVFRNPEGDHAARLIETAGLKGYCIGGACVSEKHANFIVNIGSASAADIEALIEHVAQTVARVHGVRLVREAHIVGDAS
ncbi:MAG: UDP-N-acetylmuramate dehydrogenase [Gammaproteobacteria bacterium]